MVNIRESKEMYIYKIIIQNFKCFEGDFSLELNEGLNILVGDNESGKSTILEAINLALSGWIQGKYLRTELNQSLFNSTVIDKYIQSLKKSNALPLPHILIELYFDIENERLKALFEGNGNSTKKRASGIQFKITFNDRYQAEYEILLEQNRLDTNNITSLPIEYYDYSWSSFARDDRVTPKSIPIKSALIDSSSVRNQSGSDLYISRIMRDLLSDEQKIDISQAHRKLKDSFVNSDAIIKVNKDINQKEISNKKVKLSVDMSTKSAWETNLTTYLDDIPFHFIGRGEQCLVKTKLALSHKKTQEANIILLEEPENHLSHSKLSKFIKFIKDRRQQKQIIVSTHNSFVANKLGLRNLILLNIDYLTNKRRSFRITSLENETQKYFEKLPGYDTLRLILCNKAILVEGDSDELIVQKAYMSTYKGVLPIEDEVDVISVRGLAFKRFLEIAKKIDQPVAVVTDNDGNFEKKVTKKYERYKKYNNIKICADKNNDLKTLEPQLVESNKNNLDILRKVLGIKKQKHPDSDSIVKYMTDNKTICALKIFETEENISFPQYILDAIKWDYE